MTYAINGNTGLVGAGNKATLEDRIDGCMENLNQLTQIINNNHRELIQQITELRSRIANVEGSLDHTRKEIFREGLNASEHSYMINL